MPRRRSTPAAHTSTAAAALPEHLRTYTRARIVDSGDPVRDAETNRRLVAEWRRWRAEREQWAVEHGWTRRQLLGVEYPDWIGRGWADPPPTGVRMADAEA